MDLESSQPRLEDSSCTRGIPPNDSEIGGFRFSGTVGSCLEDFRERQPTLQPTAVGWDDYALRRSNERTGPVGEDEESRREVRSEVGWLLGSLEDMGTVPF